MEYTLIATAAMGLESLVADEVRELGFECRVENARIIFKGDELAIARANLWLRIADRVKILVGEFTAKTFDQLFESTKALPWENFIEEDGEFPVSGKSIKSTLFSVPDCQAIVKKAIVERLKIARNKEGMLPETGGLYKIEVAILKDVVSLTIDTSGAGLHKRGFRVEQGEAPLKETLAAALVKITKWSPSRPFVDPFCGSGTIAIEAAMIGQNIAPGFNRDFVSETWNWFSQDIWKQARNEADSLANYDQELDIMACDIDHRMIEIAKLNAAEAGLEDVIQFKQMQAKDFTTRRENGVIVGNPPYGERLDDRETVVQLYSDLGKTYRNLDTWSIYIITSLEDFEEQYGRKATKKRKLFNGFIQTNFYQYWGRKNSR
jgi:putative N6-adenine-specific DNA methylase